MWPFQKLIGPAGYYYAPNDIFARNGEAWTHGRTWLATFNNEVSEKYRDAKQKERLLRLDALLLVMFRKDDVVFPKISEFFGRITEKNTNVTMEHTGAIWDDDRIGLRTLQEDGKIKWYVGMGKLHLRTFGPKWYINVHVE